MRYPTSTAHRVLLILSALLLGVLGVLFVVAPGVVLAQLDVEAGDRLVGMLRVAGCAVVGEATAVGWALRSGEESAVRVVTVMLVVHFSAETAVRIWSFTVGESPSLVPALPQAVLAAGLVLALLRTGHRPVQSGSVGRSAVG